MNLLILNCTKAPSTTPVVPDDEQYFLVIVDPSVGLIDIIWIEWSSSDAPLATVLELLPNLIDTDAGFL